MNKKGVLLVLTHHLEGIAPFQTRKPRSQAVRVSTGLPPPRGHWHLVAGQLNGTREKIHGFRGFQTENCLSRACSFGEIMLYRRVYIVLYPPTPAFAKAGAAPGTTAGVELFRAGFKCARQLPPSLAAAFAGPGLQPGPLPAHPSRQLPPSSWPFLWTGRGKPFLQLQQVPEALAVSF